MNPIENNDTPENPSNQFDATDLDARLSQAEDAQVGGEANATDLSDLEQRVQQLQTETEALEAQQMNEFQAQQTELAPEAPKQPASNPEPPDGHIPASAIAEQGAALRAETGAEKPEVKNFHPGGPERG